MLPAILRTTYLDMRERSDFQPRYCADPLIRIMEAVVPSVPFYRFLYGTVGGPWRWRDRLAWSDEQLLAQLRKPEISVFVLYANGTPAGYVELDRGAEGNTEVAYFGLMPGFFGRGYGLHLLSYGIQHAWDRGAARVWVHTCNLDAEQALTTYQKCGFRVYEVQEEPMPDRYQD
jgi:ribosomal protein S18 acetylase RimI-like enzyme